MATPDDLGFNISNGACIAPKDPRLKVYPNSLSPLIAAELIRRIVMFDDLPEASKWPSVTKEDILTLEYGAKESLLFPQGLTWGGMSTDTAVYIQTAIDIEKVETDAQGKWRIFSKLGAGYSSGRSVGEIVSNGYACFPELDNSGNPIPDAGVEFIVAVRGSVPEDVHLQQVELAVKKTMDAVVQAVYTHKL